MRKSNLLLSSALLVSVASAAWFWQALRLERAHSADLAAQLEQAVVERQSNVAAEPTGGSATAVAAGPAPAVAPVAAPATPAMVANGSERNWQNYQRALMSDPKYREARRAQERLKFVPRRANLIRLLGFTPEQADAAIELDIDTELFWQDARGASHGSEAEVQEARARQESFERQREDKLRSLLGEEKRSRLQGYMESRQSRMQVDDLRSELGEAHALRDDQVEPLIAALHVERARAQAELREYRDTLSWEGVNEESWRLHGERKTELMKAMNARMLSSASSLLTQRQLKALEEQLRQELAQHEAQLRLQRIQAKMQQPADPAN
jgi:hypothetical protein